jgi:hypothetical protein
LQSYNILILTLVLTHSQPFHSFTVIWLLESRECVLWILLFNLCSSDWLLMVISNACQEDVCDIFDQSMVLQLIIIRRNFLCVLHFGGSLECIFSTCSWQSDAGLKLGSRICFVFWSYLWNVIDICLQDKKFLLTKRQTCFNKKLSWSCLQFPGLLEDQNMPATHLSLQ